jgi:DnaJ-domain-containing protein 1
MNDKLNSLLVKINKKQDELDELKKKYRKELKNYINNQQTK